MTLIEQSTHTEFLVHSEHRSDIVTLPEVRYHRDELKLKGYDSAGVGILFLAQNQGAIHLLLGNHNNTCRVDQGEWGWFSETLMLDSQGKVEPTHHAVARCIEEELDVNPDSLHLLVDPTSFTVGIDLHTFKKSTGQTLRYRVLMHTFWLPDPNDLIRSHSSEISETHFFPLEDLFDNRAGLQTRDFTIPVIKQMLSGGHLYSPGVHALKTLQIQPSTVPVSQMCDLVI